MAEGQDKWKNFRIVEINDSGKLLLLEENFNKLISHLEENANYIENESIVLVSLLGPPQSSYQKSFLANVLAAYMNNYRKDGAWGKQIQRDCLNGFPFGMVGSYSHSANQPSNFDANDKSTQFYQSSSQKKHLGFQCYNCLSRTCCSDESKNSQKFINDVNSLQKLQELAKAILNVDCTNETLIEATKSSINSLRKAAEEILLIGRVTPPTPYPRKRAVVIPATPALFHESSLYTPPSNMLESPQSKSSKLDGIVTDNSTQVINTPSNIPDMSHKQENQTIRNNDKENSCDDWEIVPHEIKNADNGNEGSNVTNNEAAKVTENEAKNVTENEANNVTENEANNVTENEANNVTENEANNITENETTEVTKNEAANLIDNKTIDSNGSKTIENKNIKGIENKSTIDVDGETVDELKTDKFAESADAKILPTGWKDCTNGIYVWSGLINLGLKNQAVGLLYMYHDNPNQMKNTDISLNLFLGLVCSTIIDLQWDQMSVLSSLRDLQLPASFNQLKSHICRDVIQILTNNSRHSSADNNWDNENLKIGRTKIVTILNDAITPVENGNGELGISSHLLLQLEKPINGIIEALTCESKVKERPILNSIALKSKLVKNIEKVNQYSKLLDEDSLQLIRSNEFLQSLADMSQTCEENQKETGPGVTTRSKHRAASIKNSSNNEQDIPIASASPSVQMTGPTMTLEKREKAAEKVIEKTLQSRWGKLETKLTEFIERDLQRNNIPRILSLYDTWVDNFATDSQTTLNETSAKYKLQMLEKIKLATDQKYKPIFQNVVEQLEAFCLWMDTQFKKFPYYSPDDLQRQMYLAMEKASKRYKSKNEEPFIELGCQKLMIAFKNHNDSNIEIEQNVSSKAINQIQTFYSQCMRKFTSSKTPQSPAILAQVHEKLVEALLSAFGNVMGETRDLSDEKRKIKLLLAEEFNKISVKNMENLEALQKKIKGFIAHYKGQYEQVINTLIDENKFGIEPSKFHKTHNQESDKVCKKLKSVIISQVGESEPVDNYIVTLRKHMEKSYSAYSEENQEKYEENQKKHKQYPESKTTQQNSKTSESSYTDKYDTSKRRNKTGESDRILQPILFQIDLNQITIGYTTESADEGADRERKISTHPAEVAFSKSGEWLCGNYIQHNAETGHISKTWKLDQCLSSFLWKGEVSMNGVEHEISTEFLFAIFFSAFKTDIEREQHGIAQRTLISVPFWLSSFHRQQIVDAASIAGFENLKIVNENSACAYFWYHSKTEEYLKDTVVISENSNRVDISLYRYDKPLNKVHLIGHSGDYEVSEIPKTGKFALCVQFISGVLLYIKNWKSKEVEEEAIKTLAELWKLALSRAEIVSPRSKNRSKNVLICCQSDDWRGLLYKLAKVISADVTVRNDATTQGMFDIIDSESYKKQDSIECVIKDGIPYNICLETPSKIKHIVQEKIKTFSISGAHCTHITFSVDDGDFHIFQENPIQTTRVGVLRFDRSYQSFHESKVILRRSQDGILILESAELVAKNHTRIVRNVFSNNYFIWTTFNLTNESLATCKSILDQIQIVTDASKKATALMLVISKVQSFKEAVKSGQGSFRSSIAKDFALQQAEKIVEALSKPDLKQRQIDQQTEIFFTLANKYNIDI